MKIAIFFEQPSLEVKTSAVGGLGGLCVCVLRGRGEGGGIERR